ncbi:hypothetical protein D5086_002211, partial [Populus alba]
PTNLSIFYKVTCGSLLFTACARTPERDTWATPSLNLHLCDQRCRPKDGH